MSAQNLSELRSFQREIAEKVVLEDLYRKPVTCVAGIDLAFKEDIAVTAYVAMAFPSLKLVYRKALTSKIEFPYIPTFLSFREGPPIIEVICSSDVKPEVLLINSHGIAHPLFCGCASHVGVLTQSPTIGVAQRNLCGEYESEPGEAGKYVSMYFRERAVGWVFKSKGGCKPIFVSPGHLVSLESSLEIVRECMGGYKLPLPLHHAHIFANEERDRIVTP
jgi:deoxyribonuclease V